MGQFFSNCHKNFMEISDQPETFTALNTILSVAAKSFMAGQEYALTFGFLKERTLRPLSDAMSQIAGFIDVYDPNEASEKTPEAWREQQYTFLALATDSFYEMQQQMLGFKKSYKDEAYEAEESEIESEPQAEFGKPWPLMFGALASMATPYQRSLERKIRDMYSQSDMYPPMQLINEMPDGYMLPQGVFSPREMVTHLAACAGVVTLETHRLSRLARDPERRQMLRDVVDTMLKVADLDLMRAPMEKVYGLREETIARKIHDSMAAFEFAEDVLRMNNAPELAFMCKQVEGLAQAVVGPQAIDLSCTSHFQPNAAANGNASTGNVVRASFGKGRGQRRSREP